MSACKMSLPVVDFAHTRIFQDELWEFADKLAAAAPGLVRVSDIGNSREGRRILLLTISDFGTGDDREKAGFFVQAGIHAHETGGVNTALDLAVRLISEHCPGGILEHTAFYIMPSVNPDGSEFVAAHGCMVRGAEHEPDARPNRIEPADLTGDGDFLFMLRETPEGNLCRDPRDPRCLVRRRADSQGPYYKHMPEGYLRNWDGMTINDTADPEFGYYRRQTDFNRNWSSFWSPEQFGSGDFPFSEPEIRLQAEFLASHWNICGAVAFHNGPCGLLGVPDTPQGRGRIPPNDQRAIRDILLAGAELTGFPYYEGGYLARHCLDPELQLHGQFPDYCYFNLGIFCTLLELGTILTSAGISAQELYGEAKHRDTERFTPPEVAAFQDAHPELPQGFPPRKKFLHPQLGEVEIGEYVAPVFGSPAPEDAARISEKVMRFIVSQAVRHPQLTVTEVHTDAVDDETWRIRIKLFNRGELPTSITELGRRIARRRGPVLVFQPGESMELLSMNGLIATGHFAPWEARCFEWFLKGRPVAELGKIRIDGQAAGTFCIDIFAKNKQ